MRHRGKCDMRFCIPHASSILFTKTTKIEQCGMISSHSSWKTAYTSSFPKNERLGMNFPPPPPPFHKINSRFGTPISVTPPMPDKSGQNMRVGGRGGRGQERRPTMYVTPAKFRSFSFSCFDVEMNQRTAYNTNITEISFDAVMSVCKGNRQVCTKKSESSNRPIVEM